MTWPSQVMRTIKSGGKDAWEGVRGRWRQSSGDMSVLFVCVVVEVSDCDGRGFHKTD